MKRELRKSKNNQRRSSNRMKQKNLNKKNKKSNHKKMTINRRRKRAIPLPLQRAILIETCLVSLTLMLLSTCRTILCKKWMKNMKTMVKDLERRRIKMVRGWLSFGIVNSMILIIIYVC